MPASDRLLTSLVHVALIAACRPDCPDGVTDRNGYQCTPVPGDDTTSTTSTEESSSTTNESSTSSASDESSSTADTSSSTGAPPCNNNGQCDPSEDVLTCPDECNVCGDSVVLPPESCDNGQNQDPPYSPSPPSPTACAPGCLSVQFCGDSLQNGPEPCDSAATQTATCESDCTLPTCGDGILNSLVGELCDDHNTTPGDGCSDTCLPERRVFVSSAFFKGDLNKGDNNPDALAGLPLADFRCNTLATAAGLSGTFKAWLSDSETSPSTRFDITFKGLYRLLSPDFPILAIGWPDLTDGSLTNPINADETGATILGNVFTNTNPDGSSASSEEHCTAWTESDESYTTVGKSSVSDTAWSSAAKGLCSDDRRLYCFEDP